MHDSRPFRVTLRIAAVFMVFILLFATQRAIFLAIYSSLIAASMSESFKAMTTGMAMDASLAGYLTAIPLLLTLISVWINPSKIISLILKIYYALVAIVLALILTSDLVLYSYWGFRLDMTPVFYLTTSPASAMASAEWWQLIVAPVAVVALAAAIYFVLNFVTRLTPTEAAHKSRVATTAALALMSGLIFVAIRGGITVSTMNPSRAYFSANPRLNHAALNPAFSLMYSAGHHDDFANSFRYFPAYEAAAIFKNLNEPVSTVDTVPEIKLTDNRPDIYLIILESFSSHLMPSLGGEPIAVHLDSIAREGILWTDFYACSFRTDRAIPAIINAFPSQPTTSLMKYVDKIEALPSIAGELKRQAGYVSTYFYGGDANFTNMLACLVSGGFDRIVSDKDFKVSERLSKWGAHDDVLFNRVISDTAKPDKRPRLNVIQTSSSHEPFEVPAVIRGFSDNKRANSLAFTDSCLYAFVQHISADPARSNSLIIIVPDHYGTWPERGTLEKPLERHRIPLVMTGDALSTSNLRISTVGSQIDIVATIMGLLGLDSSMFKFSKNLLDPRVNHFAWFSEPELAALVNNTGSVAVLNTAADRPELLKGKDADSLLTETKAYLQTIYTTIANLK